VTSHELLSFNVVWLGLQAWELLMWLRARTTAAQFGRAISTVLLTAVGSVVAAVVLLTATGEAVQQAAGRLLAKQGGSQPLQKKSTRHCCDITQCYVHLLCSHVVFPSCSFAWRHNCAFCAILQAR
jgi:hypothetical protein